MKQMTYMDALREAFVEEMKRDNTARAIWREVYAELSVGKTGLLGAATSRAEAQVMRLALLYALLDRSRVIAAEHLTAESAGVDDGSDVGYCEEVHNVEFTSFGIHFNFGNRTGMRLSGVRIHLACLRIDVALGFHIHAASGNCLAVFEVSCQS